MSEEVSRQRRRADALALIAEDSVRSYPSWISELSRKSPGGINRRRYAYEHLGAGEALELVRGPTNSSSDHAVSYYHRAVHLGYVPKQHHWIADALDTSPRGHCRKCQIWMALPSARKIRRHPHHRPIRQSLTGVLPKTVEPRFHWQLVGYSAPPRCLGLLTLLIARCCSKEASSLYFQYFRQQGVLKAVRLKVNI